MNNFITIDDYDASIHRDILDSLLREGTDGDAAIVEICEDRAIAEMKSYLSKTYNTGLIFAMKGHDRHPLILMMAVDIAVYHIFSLHNPYKISQLRKDRYDRAIAWLKSVAKGDVTIEGAPRLDEETQAENSPWQIRSNALRETHM